MDHEVWRVPGEADQTLQLPEMFHLVLAQDGDIIGYVNMLRVRHCWNAAEKCYQPRLRLYLAKEFQEHYDISRSELRMIDSLCGQLKIFLFVSFLFPFSTLLF